MARNDFFAFIGTADCRVDFLSDTGEHRGFERMGNCNECSVKANSELKELTGNGLTTFGQTIASVNIPKPMTATIKFNQVSSKLFDTALMGESVVVERAATTTATTKTVRAIKGRGVDLGARNITVTGVENASGEALTEGTDYRLDARIGHLTLLEGSAEADGAELTVSYTALALNGSVTRVMVKSNTRIAINLDGQNFADGRRFIADIFMMRLASDTEISFIGEDFAEFSFTGTLETPPDKDTPMEIMWID